MFKAQLIMMFSFLFFGAAWIADHHWPFCMYVVNAVIVALLGFLIPINPEAYK